MKFKFPLVRYGYSQEPTHKSLGRASDIIFVLILGSGCVDFGRADLCPCQSVCIQNQWAQQTHRDVKRDLKLCDCKDTLVRKESSAAA